MEPSEGITNEELLEYAAFAEVYSNHPLHNRFEMHMENQLMKNNR